MNCTHGALGHHFKLVPDADQYMCGECGGRWTAAQMRQELADSNPYVDQLNRMLQDGISQLNASKRRLEDKLFAQGPAPVPVAANLQASTLQAAAARAAQAGLSRDPFGPNPLITRAAGLGQHVRELRVAR